MPAGGDPEEHDDRTEFAARVRLAVEARYRGKAVDVDLSRFALRVVAPGIDVALPLAPLQHSCQREPAKTAQLISAFVRSVERQLTPATEAPFRLAAVIWCVRTQRYLAELARSDELLTAPVGGDLVAFVAETLPGSIMQGVPRESWERDGHTEAEVRAGADGNTAAHFAALRDRIGGAERIPADGWRLASDSLFQGSIILVPEILRAFVGRAGCDVLYGLPDRGVVRVIPVDAPGADHFTQRVVREWREAMNPCSRTILRSDGSTLDAMPVRARGMPLMGWLRD